MAGFQAFSSVVVTDYSDVGHVNLYLTSNQPTTVLYDPNQGIYTPNWKDSNLIITPVVSFNGTNVDLTSPGLVVSFTRKEGSGTATALTTGETITGNQLVVSANKLSTVSSKLLTYLCDITYTDQDTGVPISAQATLTYTLVANATDVKYVTIIGESAFLYNTNREIVGTDSITLTAELTNTSIKQWQYKKSDGTFAAFPTTNNSSIASTTLIVKSTESDIWLNDKSATIKVVTNDDAVYDVHSITKIYDGAAGDSVISAVLSNENHLVPVSSDGTVKSWNGAETTITIYEGGEDVTSLWTINVSNGDGLSGNYNSSTKTYTPSALSKDASYAEFTCTKTGYANVVKRYTITKQYAGNDGNDAVIYTMAPSVLTMNLNESGEFTPSDVTFNAYRTIGNENSTSYACRFVIQESTDGTTFTTKYTSSSDETTKKHTPTDNTVKAIKCIMYQSGGTTIQLDEQTVMITKDGKSGEDGQPGSNGVSVVVGNDSEVIPCNTSGNAVAKKDISIPFYGYDGISKAAITCTVGTLPSGVTVKSNTAGTATNGGLLVLTVAKDATLGGSSIMSGDISLTFVCMGQSIEKKFTWTKSVQAESGSNAVIFQLYSPDGGTIYNGEGSTTINSMLMDGASEATATSYKWYKYSDGTYNAISGQTKSNLVVDASMVDATAWFKCEAVYNNVTYSAYWTIYDKSDPVMAYTFSTVGQFQNSQGCGAIYTRVYRNGEEIDPIKTLTFSETAPATASSGDYYYHLDSTAKTCVLKKYSGSKWEDATETDELNYAYYRINSSGVELDATQAYKTIRCFYIDPSIIDGQMQFRCKVTN